MKQLLWFTIFSLLEYKHAAEPHKSSNLTKWDPPTKLLLYSFRVLTPRGPEVLLLTRLCVWEPVNHTSSTKCEVQDFTSQLQFLNSSPKNFKGSNFTACLSSLVHFQLTPMRPGVKTTCLPCKTEGGQILPVNFGISVGSGSWSPEIPWDSRCQPIKIMARALPKSCFSVPSFIF